MEVVKGGEMNPKLQGDSLWLAIESVQEIVRRDSGHVPDKYIRDDKERPNQTLLSHLSSQAPVIDFSLLSKSYTDELKKLDIACRDWGFFQVINHGFEDLQQKAKNVIADFLKLPLEEKKKYLITLNELDKYGQVGESEDQKVDWVDNLYLKILPLSVRNLEAWPTTPPHFKDIILEYSDKVNKIAKELFANIAIMMGLDKATLLESHGELLQTMKINYYPTCSKSDQVLGLSPHSDCNSLTILSQDDDVTGLHIRRDGGWVPINPIPGALIVNIGDCIEIWSNGRYKSIEHRAVTNNHKPRTSIVTFFEPSFDAFVGPLPDSDDKQYTLLYKKVKYGDYVMNYMSKELDGKNHTQFTKLENK